MNFSARSSTRKPGLHSRNGICVAQNAQAARIGAEILGDGGNAYDAAIATSFALGVLEPWMSGIGGGGGLLLRDMASGTVQGIDFGLVAPKGLDPATYALTDGYSGDMFPWRNVIEDRNVTGIHSVATPGVVAGMGRLHSFGATMQWADLLAPAIALAREGVVGDYYSQLYISTFVERLLQDAGLQSTFLSDGCPPGAASLATGQARWQMLALADTLERLAHAGWQDFYTGDIAQTLASETAAIGGSLGRADLQGYNATLGPAKSTIYSGAEVFLAPGLSAGKTLARTLELSEQSKGTDWHAAMAQALHQAQDERWRDDGDPEPPKTPDCTTHFAISDTDGNLVSTTQTILAAFGAGIMLPKTGIMLNNGMMWFDPEPGRANSIAPGKRCLMNIAPTIARTGDTFHAVGAAGGRRILSAVAHLVGYLADRGMSGEDAIHAPRTDCSLTGIVTCPPGLAALKIKGCETRIAPALPWPLTYAIPSVLSVGNDGSTGCADPVSPWADAAAPTPVTAKETS
ncbi:MAG: gamma-glutamyltransferase [Roseovarius sp.]|nr:gamma-glutamyltransferase [Roseovarius sp.]